MSDVAKSVWQQELRNKKFEEYTSLRGKDILNKKITTVLPGIRKGFDWVRAYGEVALEGKEIEFEQYSEPLNKHYKITACSPKKGYFITFFSDITKMVFTEQQLLENRQRLKLALDASEIGFWDWNLQTDEVYFSERYYTMLGYEPGAFPMSYSSWKNLLHPDDHHVIPLVENYIAKAKPYQVDFRLRCKNGNYKWISGQGKTYVRDKSGSPLQVVGLHMDIDNRKRDELKLAFQAEILEQIQDMIIATDLEGRITYANQAEIKTFGESKDDLLGKFIHTLGKDSLTETTQQEIIDTTLARGSWRGEVVNYTKTGKEIILDSRVQLIRDHQNKPTGMVGISTDITRQKEAESKLHNEIERLAVTLQSIGDGVITTDIHGKVMLVNNVATKLTGWKQNEAVGKPLNTVFEISNQNTDEPHENPVEKVLSTGKIVQLQNGTILISRTGKRYLIADSGAPIKNLRGQTIGVVLVFRDMTAKHKMQKIVQRAAKMESLGILAGGIAHDFNNLLGGIYGYIDLACMVNTNQEIAEYLDSSAETISRARHLTGQLLTFAKGGSPVREVTSLFPFIKETANFALSGSNVNCTCKVPDNLWHCFIDKNQIVQVVENLVINAKQAMPNGGKIQITAANIHETQNAHPELQNNKYVKISIKDAGTGIPANLIPHIFDPFYTTKARGHGLGLATSHSIMEKHDGLIEVDSKPGVGTTFHLYLPATTRKNSKTKQDSTSLHQGEETFIIMDDEPALLKTMKFMLTSFGYKVICYQEGSKLIEFYQQGLADNLKIKAMIFDLTIPSGMGGKETVAHIRKLNPEIPIFVSSGYSDNPVISNPEKYGFTDSISKPFRLKKLSRLLDKHLSKNSICE
jgi:two-component system cell cycle sensor histidine kinase/response regulator CckA